MYHDGARVCQRKNRDKSNQLSGSMNNQIGKSNRPLPFVVALLAPLLASMGCGGTDEAGAEKYLKDQQMLPLTQNDRVYSLNALGKEITAETATKISDLRGLKNLDLARCSFTDEILTTAVKDLNLVSIVLSNTPVTDAGLDALTSNGRIEAVFLSNTAITDDGLKALGKLGTVTELDLSGTKITSAGLAHLGFMSSLKRLILDGTAVDDSGMEHIQKISTLAKLEVRETQVTDEGAGAIAKAISGLIVER